MDRPGARSSYGISPYAGSAGSSPDSLPPRGGGSGALSGEKSPDSKRGGAANEASDLIGEDPIGARMRVEAILLLSNGPVPPRKLSSLAGLPDATAARTAVTHLNQHYDELDRALRVEMVAGGYRLMTRGYLAPWLSRLSHLPPPVRLSLPMLETLAVVAYRNPVSRAEVESIRGVACGELLRQLMERDLVRITGRSEELGRPYLYGTTKRFLQTFGLSSAEALPPIRLESLQDEFSTPIQNPSDSLPEDSTKEPVVNTAMIDAPRPANSDLSAEDDSPLFAAGAAVLAAAEPPAAVIEDEEDDLYEDDNSWDDDEDDDWDDPDDDDGIDVDGDEDDEDESDDDDDSEEDDDSEDEDDSEDDDDSEADDDLDDDWEEVDDDESDDEFEGEDDLDDDDEDWGDDVESDEDDSDDEE